jgi:hypothetical protein
LTGYFVRIKRDNSYQNIEIDQFTDAELNEFATGPPEDGWKWAVALAKWIRDHVKDGD